MNSFLTNCLTHRHANLVTALLLCISLMSPIQAAENTPKQSEQQPWQALENQHFISLSSQQQLAFTKENPTLHFYFWPGSASCYQVELALQKWQLIHTQIKVVRVPLIKRPNWRLLAKVYLVAEDLQLADAVLNLLYDSIHQQQMPIESEAQLTPLLQTMSIDEIDFFARLHSPEINLQLSSLETNHKTLPLTGVPSFIINGQWQTDASLASTPATLLKVIDHLFSQSTTVTEAVTDKL